MTAHLSVIRKKWQRVVDRRFLVLLVCFFLLVAELQHQLLSFRAVCVQTVASPAVSTLNGVLRLLRVALQVLLHVAVHLVEVGLEEKGAIMVVDVLGQLLGADARHAYIQKYS